MSYYTKITKAGLAAITAAMNNNTKVPITYMAFGDGNGSIPEPDESATSLVNEVYRTSLNKVEIHSKNPNWLVCEAIIPSAVGGFNIREIALYDNTGNTMLAIASYPPTYKPTVEEGAAKIQTIRIVIQVDNTGNFELVINPDVVLATAEFVERKIKENKGQSILHKQTVQEMKEDITLQAGNFIKTVGYHNLFDQGGALYYISNKMEDFSIMLNNGLYANFCDDFDIRKFGIQNNATIDQTEEFRRLVAYADSRIYEIDFLNFKVMTPKITHFVTGRGSTVKGLGFNETHSLKNLKITNDKTQKLMHGTSQILFLPRNNFSGTFKLRNVEFDPYVQSFELNSGEYDGMMLGFLAHHHKDWVGFDNSNLTDFNFDFKDINFISPAISYNISLAGLFSKKTILENLTGDYWGLYAHVFTKNFSAKNCHGIFRDDLHTGSNRLLVNNLFHEEPEIAGKTVTQDQYYIENCSCFKKTNNKEYVVYKNHAIGNTTINKFTSKNCKGIIEFYSGSSSQNFKTIINEINFIDTELLLTSLACRVGTFNSFNTNKSSSYIINENIIENLNFYGKTTFLLAIGITTGTAQKVYIDHAITSDANYGLIRASINVDEFYIQRLDVLTNKAIECSFKKIEIDVLNIKYSNVLNNAFFSNSTSGDFTPKVQINKLIDNENTLSSFILFKDTLRGELIIKDSNIKNSISGNYLSKLSYSACKISKSFDIAPDPILANADLVTEFTFSGADFGDQVQVAYSKNLGQCKISATVTSINKVTVTITNPSSNQVELESGKFLIHLLKDTL